MRLVIEDEAGTRSAVPLTAAGVVVGRGADDVAFRLSERNVSRRHARFLVQNGAAFVEDLGSSNGTRVNGERISGRRKLRDGDLVQIGDYDLAVVRAEEATPAGATAPPPLPVTDGGAPRARPPTPPPSLAPPGPAPASVPPSARSGSLGAAVVAGVVALAIGVAAGYATGVLTEPAPSAAVTRP